MKAKLFIKGLITLIVCIVLWIPPAHAETDPNVSVSDCIGKGKECGTADPAADKVDNETVSDTEPSTDTPKGLSAWDYIRTLLAFVFVIGLLVWLLRFLNKRNRSFDQNRLMTNLGGVPLGQHKSIQLVKMGNHYFVVGVGENVQLLKEIEDPAEIEELLARYDRDDRVIQNGLLTQLYQRFFKNKKSENTSVEPTDFSQLFSSKIEEIKADRKQQLDRLKGKGSDRDD
ncbi:flagellar biosynthetic protein FliO [Sporosarcina obsidiansis]|uniref:flagellar biosynthetic protein FliO n=1 Tax=Sporosarcina obsidiansis TaxID=2660748 RepID=UPI00129A4B31|nr:flagellar biosynthetic protein FliO [Sporosarcina obsidiansis]